MMENNNDPETTAIIDIVKPFISREKLRGKTHKDVNLHLNELIGKLTNEEYKIE